MLHPNCKESASEWVNALPLPNQVDGATHVLLVEQADVYFILIGNPFVGPGRRALGESGSNEAATRMVRNQILIRGAPVVARSLTVAGTAAMARGISMRSEPVKSKRFLHIDRRSRKDVLKHQHGKEWKTHFRAEKKQFVHFRKNTKIHGQIDIQERRVKRRGVAGKNLRATTLRGAGGMMILAGRLVPTLAASMVVSSYIGKPGGGYVTQTDIMSGKAKFDYERAGTDIMTLGTMMSDNVMTIASAAATGYQIGSAIIKNLGD